MQLEAFCHCVSMGVLLVLSSVDAQEKSPEEDLRAQVLAHWQVLQEEVRWKGPCKETEIKDRTKPVVLSS